MVTHVHARGSRARAARGARNVGAPAVAWMRWRACMRVDALAACSHVDTWMRLRAGFLTCAQVPQVAGIRETRHMNPCKLGRRVRRCRNS